MILDDGTHIVFEGSVYDVSGGDNHPASTTNLDLTERTPDNEDVYSWNLRKGYDLYTDDATELINLYVPYKDGYPIVASVASYTKQRTSPALLNGCNMANVTFDYSAVAGTPFDRSDNTKWNSLARGATYDSGNPSQWHVSDHSMENLINWVQPAHQHKFYLATEEGTFVYSSGQIVVDGNGYAVAAGGLSISKFMNIIYYSTSRTAIQDVKVAEWLEKYSKFQEVV